ncbi:probable phosphoglycerate mutase [Microbacterium sp. cf046]|uniref:histidine phosphatase family protein n=1 Tax=Microbacterium sp. cf046 TaxID=1761803 RepID=UPI0008ECF922|nr:histidine phosphatase family protein [Microbacterium sp. cf046]SFS04375.1 probable phosphoglycerate mutase [Microbacterium sp. cf046]
MTLLTLVRHGETDWNRDRRIQGSTDIPLNDTGRAQARDAADAVRVQLDLSGAGTPPIVVSSDLARARETARIIAAELDLPAPREYPGLRERAYGEAEGLDADDFIRRWGDWHTAEIPGAEPWPHLRERGLRALATVVRDVRLRTAPTAASVIVVTHGAMIRELIRHATAGEMPPAGERLANGSAYSMLYERERLSLLSYAGATS